MPEIHKETMFKCDFVLCIIKINKLKYLVCKAIKITLGLDSSNMNQRLDKLQFELNTK